MSPYRMIDWKNLKPGDRIVWRKDHTCERERQGLVIAVRSGVVAAWPDDPNYGTEPRGGCSEILFEDILGLLPHERWFLVLITREDGAFATHTAFRTREGVEKYVATINESWKPIIAEYHGPLPDTLRDDAAERGFDPPR